MTDVDLVDQCRGGLSPLQLAAASTEEIHATARCLRAVLAALRAELDDPAYNIVVRTAPGGYEAAPFLV